VGARPWKSMGEVPCACGVCIGCNNHRVTHTRPSWCPNVSRSRSVQSSNMSRDVHYSVHQPNDVQIQDHAHLDQLSWSGWLWTAVATGMSAMAMERTGYEDARVRLIDTQQVLPLLPVVLSSWTCRNSCLVMSGTRSSRSTVR
jgi:hypothetical protein